MNPSNPKPRFSFLRLTALLAGLASVVFAADQPDLRIGVIGLDSSHAPSFAKLLNDPANPEHVPGGRIVAAFRGGSPDVANSVNRIDRFTQEMTGTYGVKLCDTIGELLAGVDAVMILSVDGRAHLDQARQAFAARKPVYIDKPMAGSLRDAIAIFRLARESGTPCFSSSSRRFDAAVVALREDPKLGKLQGVFSYGPADLEPHHPDLFWYGIHATEALYTVMGQGCVSVTRTSTRDVDVVTGVWSDGRVGTVCGVRNSKHSYSLTAYGTKGVVVAGDAHGYAPLVTAIIRFFRTGIAPVTPAETIEILTCLEAADESKRLGGVPVDLAGVLQAAGGFARETP